VENIFRQIPEPGTWVIEVFAIEVNEDGHEVYVDDDPAQCLGVPREQCVVQPVVLDADFALVLSGARPDCNENQVADEDDIDGGTSCDCNTNDIPDECEAILHVDASASGRDGTGWGDAFRDLQGALAAARNNCAVSEIWVAAGTYTPDVGEGITPGDRTETFELVDGVRVVGGFPERGGDGTFGARDPSSYKTILSGDLGGNDGPGFANRSDNAHHVVKADLTTGTALLDGFVITGGNADGSGADAFGGGMSIISGSPTITGCEFRGNSATDTGGAIYNLSGSPTLTNCLFSGNRTTAGSGGAIRNSISSHPAMVNCTFTENSAPSGEGGAIRNDGESNPVLTNCVLWGNSDSSGTGMSAQMSNELGSDPDVTYSCVQDGTPGSQGVYPGTGNIDLDPEFVDSLGADGFVGTGDEDLHLYASSPCIEAGNDAVVTEATDLDGAARQHDADSDPAADVDMGAYEFGCFVVETPVDPPSGEEAGFIKNRYVTLMPGSAGEQTALRVMVVESEKYPDSVGEFWWVGAPQTTCENGGYSGPPPACPATPPLPSSFKSGSLQCSTPHYTDWHGVCDQNVCVEGLKAGDSCLDDQECQGILHVYGEGIVPAGWHLSAIQPMVYGVQAIHDSCDTSVEANFSAPLVVPMSRWGDVVGDCITTPCTAPDGDVSVTWDVTAVLDKFNNYPGTAMKVRCDIVPFDASANRLVDINDVLSANEAYLGWAYPFSNPTGACP
jgi:hypothetical protein